MAAADGPSATRTPRSASTPSAVMRMTTLSMSRARPDPGGQRDDERAVEGRQRLERVGRRGSPRTPARAAAPRRPASRDDRPRPRRRRARRRAPRRPRRRAPRAGPARPPRSSAVRYALRLDIASPSGSRTSGHPTTVTGRSRSRAIRRTTASCWKSLRPKYAWHGPDDREQLGDHGGDAVEVRRARRAAHPVGEPGDVHRRPRRSVRVHLVDVRTEHHVDTGGGGHRRRRRRGRAGTRRDPRSVRTASGSRTTRPPRGRARPPPRSSATGARRGRSPSSAPARPSRRAARAASVAARTSAIVVDDLHASTVGELVGPARRGRRSGGPSRGTPRARRPGSPRGGRAPSRRRRARPAR